jgi:hypothetical protein
MFSLKEILSDLQKKTSQKKSFNLSKKIAQGVPGLSEEPNGGIPQPVVQEEVVQPPATTEEAVSPAPVVPPAPQKQIPYEINGDDLVARFLDKMVREAGDSVDVWNEFLVGGVERKLGSPSKKNIRNDPRLLFFDEHRELLPDSVRSAVEREEVVSGPLSGVNFADFILQVEESKKNNVNPYYGNMFQELIQILRDTIENNFAVVDEWVRSGVASEKKQNVYDKERRHKGFQDKGIGGEGMSIEETFGDEGVSTSEKALRGSDEYEKKQSDHMTRIYAGDYLMQVLKGVKKLSYDVFKEMYNDASKLRKESDPVKKRRGEKLQTKAERNIVYMDSCSKQLEKLFSGEAIQNGEVTTTMSGDDLIYQKRSKEGKSHEGAMKVPFSEIEGLYSYIKKKVAEATGGKEEQVDITKEDPNSSMMQDIIKNYIEGRGGEWVSDWRKLISEEKLADSYKNIGELKNKIKKYKGYDADTIRKAIPDLNSLFANDDDLINFIKGSLVEDGSVANKWLNTRHRKGTPKKDFKGKLAPGGEAGTDYPKAQVATDVKSHFLYLWKLKNEQNIPNAVLKAYLDLFKPHSGITEGATSKGGSTYEGGSGSVVDNMNYTDLYYNLIGEPENVPAMSLVGGKIRDLKKRKENIKENIEIGKEDKNIQINELNKKIKKYKDLMGVATKKDTVRVDLKRTRSRIEKAEKKLEQLKREQKRPSIKPSGEFVIPKGQQNLMDKIREQKMKESLQEAELKEYEKFISPLLANSEVFKMVCAAFEETNNYITKLNNIKNKYKFMKVAFKVDGIDNAIYSVMKSFDDKYGFIFE